MGYSHLLILGDFNYKVIQWDELAAPEKSIEECFLEATLENCLTQHVTEITRRRGDDEPSVIDLVFTNEESMIDSISYNSPLGKSDHMCLTFEFECYWTQKESKKVKRLFHRANYEDMKKALGCTEWDDALPSIDLQGSRTEQIWTGFRNIMDKLINKYVPQSRKSYKKHAVPLDRETRDMIRQKDRLSRKINELKRQKKYSEMKSTEVEFKKLRNKIRTKTRIARKAYEKKALPRK